MAMIVDNIQEVSARIARACDAAGRPVSSVTLLAVSKTQRPEAVREALDGGQRRFGENYVQEALDKIAALADRRAELEWHLIGPLQSNKTRVVAEAFDWVHTIDRLKLAERLSAQRPEGLPPLQVCLQVNISGEASKSGLAPRDVPALAQAVQQMPRLKLRGLMAIPEPGAPRERYREVRMLFEELKPQFGFDTLSMGMSDDMALAIAEGSTMVRIGTAIFGPRQKAESAA